MQSFGIILLCVACHTDSSRSAGFDGVAAYAYAGQQVAFGPRVPGTQAAQRAGDWIVEQMRRTADTVMVQAFDYKTADGTVLHLRNIFARFRPELSDRILYVTHWDSRPRSENAKTPADQAKPVPGADDGASGVGMFVALGDLLKKKRPDVGVDLLFTDGEDYGSFTPDVDVLIGAAYFAAHPPVAGYRPLFGVLWDMIGDKDLRIPQEENSVTYAPEVVQRVWSVASELGHADVFVPEVIGGIDDDHIPMIKAGYRIIDVIDIDYPAHHTPYDTMDKISAKSLGIVGDVAAGVIYRQ